MNIFLFEGIGKNFPFNSILGFATLSDFKMRTVTICAKGVGVGGSSFDFQPAKTLPPPPQYSKPWPPKYSKPSYTYVTS